MTQLRNLCACILVVCAGHAQAAACSAASGAATLPLVELYTSEGCDSCPPADRWLSAGFPPGSAAAAVLAFHVDYWDRLGWKDRFAAPEYTARQYASMRANGATFVYTPQVLVQGRDAGRSDRAGAVEVARARAPRATISATVDDAIRVRAGVADRALHRNAEIWVAYAESGLVSDVKSGENRGVKLHHDHVVRALRGPFRFDDAGNVDTTVTIAPPAERGRHGTLVVFAQNRVNGEVLQSLSLRCDRLP